MQNSKRGPKPKVVPDEVPPHVELCILMGVGLAVGLNKSQLADALGISKPTLYKYLNEHPVLVGTFQNKAKLLTSASIAQQVKDATAVRERQYIKALNNIDGFLEDTEDKGIQYRATVDTIDRFEGKATQRIEQKSSTVHEVRVALPAAELNVLRALVSDRAQLFLPPPIDVEEVTESSLDATE